MIGPERPSLVVTALPRSMSSLVFHHARAPLGLLPPNWASDGEVLNVDRHLMAYPVAPLERHHLREDDGELFSHALGFARDAMSSTGRAYKDVTQPFVIERLLLETPGRYRVLRIARSIPDVALAMLGRNWTWPARRYPGHESTVALIQGLLDARDALDRIGGCTVSFDDLVLEENALLGSLRALYPDVELGVVQLHDDLFRRTRDEVLARRNTSEHQRLSEMVLQIEAERSALVTMAAPVSLEVRRRPRLLAVGDGFAPTGFSRVLENILVHLVDDFDVHQLAIKYEGRPHPYPWTLHRCLDMRGAGELGRLCAQLRPDVVFLVNDIWILDEYMRAIAAAPGTPRTVAYCPVDSDPVDPGFLAGLSGLDRLVAYNNFGCGELQRAAAKLNGQVTWGDVAVIPHGVDTRAFHPLVPVESDSDLVAARRSTRARLFGADSALNDAFIVLNANRNQPRKCVDLTMEGFARFAQGKDDVRLYLHMGTEDLGWNVGTLADRHGIAHKMLISTNSRYQPGLSVSDLNRVFNACDVGINTSYAEGWGLVAVEHAATGAAQIVPRHTGPAELWRDHAEFLEIRARFCAPRVLTRMYFTSSDDVADSLERLYVDRPLLEARCRQAHALAMSPEFSWPVIAQQWRTLLLEQVAATGAAVEPH